MTWERTYHPGDQYPPLTAQFSYGRDSGLSISGDFTSGLTYTMTAWDAGDGSVKLNAVQASFVSAVGNVLTVKHDWVSTELGTSLTAPGRYRIRFATSVGGKAVWLPGEGRELFVVMVALTE